MNRGLRRLSLPLLAMSFGLFSLPLLAAEKPPKPEESWDNLSRLKAGTRIEVVDMNLKKVKGVFLSFSEGSITFRASKTEQSINRPDVYRVNNRDNNKHLRNGLIGVGIGVGAGLGIGAATCGTCSDSWRGTVMGAMAGMGGGLGAIGFAVGSHETVYRAAKVQKK
jgi:hypothetical protein